MTTPSDRVGARAGGWASVAIAILFGLPAAAQTGQPASAYKAPVISDTGKLKGPRQPIFFRHDIHARQDQIPCLYCHSTVTISSEPGIPAVQTCFGCHQMIGGSTPSHQAEIKKVRDAWANRRPPEWIRVHSLPGCISCHGDVRQMPQVYQVSTLTMGWCINCHVQRNVPRDCTLCHY